MGSPFVNSHDNKHYFTLSHYNLQRFGRKVFKAVLDCGFTCPNIDGTRGVDGCIFCDGGSGYFTHTGLTVTQQLALEHERISAKHGADVPMIAYFQANTNTYAGAEKLYTLYNEALAFPNVCGISVGTRADCLPDDVLDVLSVVNERNALTVELGMQTVHEETIGKINRCYTHEEFLSGYFKLKKRGIRVCLHIINSLPGENTDMMTETARQTAQLLPDAVKLQMLHVIRGTRLAEMYENGEISLLTREEYIDVICRQLEVLPPDTVIERITGDGDRSKLIAPMWSADKIATLGGIDKRLALLGTWQGRLYK